jgi:predicted metal-dependent TIM-barrel fold hydrolase
MSYALCIPRLEKTVNRSYILKTFTKLNIGYIESINEIPLRNDANYKRIIIKVIWNTSTPNSNIMLEHLQNNETVKVVHDMPWYWKVVATSPQT